ncbi:hypothetical protein AAG906_002077 [Vitis piasezkii]
MSSCNCHQLSLLYLWLFLLHSPPSSKLNRYLQFRNPPLLHSPQNPPKPTSPSRSTASWVDALRSRTRSNDFREAISTYIEMTVSGARPDNFAFGGFEGGIHAAAVKFGYGSSSVTVANTLVNMYGKCGGIGDVCKVFDRITDRDQVSWNSFIAALCRFEKWEQALEAFRAMQMENMELSSFTLVSVALACSNLGVMHGLRLGKQLHGYSLRVGDQKTFTNNALMAMYAKLGRVDDSKALFESFVDRDMVSWNTMISSFSQSDRFSEALAFFRLMVLEGVELDGVTIASVLPACSHLERLDVGKEIHAYVLRNNDLIENSFVGSALVDMYCNCRQVESGRRVFDHILGRRIELWNAMISGYARNGLDEKALILFIEMIKVAGLLPNTTTMASVMPASSMGITVKLGFKEDRYVQNALMDMYSRMGKMDISETIFDSMEVRDRVSWNTMITGSMENTKDMKKDDNDDEKGPYKPNAITLMTVLPGCAALAAIAKGKEIHAYAIRNMLASDITVGSALVDMYAKCGCLNLSRRVFDEMPNKNVITWNVLIMACGMHGKGEEALELFKNMVAEAGRGGEAKPNEVTFITVFAACSHSGLISEGLNLFYRMKHDHGVEPTSDHYACVVDLLGRAGQLEEAYELVNTMPAEFDKVGAWVACLGSCSQNLLHLEPNVASHYANGSEKEPGCSWIEFRDEVHKFMAGDVSHPQSEQLHGFLETLSEKMRKEVQENLLCGHSEKLAIAFGILNTPPGTTIQ